MKYTSVSKVEDYLQQDIDPAFVGSVENYIEAMSRHMDNTTGRTLVSDTEETRTYDGNNLRSLPIDEVREVSAVTLDDTELTLNTDYYLQPNGSNYPSYEVSSDNRYFLATSRGNIAITGKFGFYAYDPEDEESVFPSDIEFACTVLVAGILRGIQGEGNEISSERIGDYSVSYTSPQERADLQLAKATIKRYTRVI